MRSTGQSKLPDGGGSSPKGLPVDPRLPGTTTFVTPRDERDSEDPSDTSIYDVEYPKDLPKDQTRQDTRNLSPNHPSFSGRGVSDRLPKYPYRDGIPTTHNASMIVELWKLQSAPTLTLTPGSRVAATLDGILTSLNPKVVERAGKCQAHLKRVDRKNLRWLFAVDCGNGAKVVKVKASRKGRVVKFSKMDLDISCSCPAWQWLGPEHHAKSNQYLDGKPRGTASVPVVKDPTMVNRVCKHVAAVLSMTRQWEIPLPKGKR